MRYKLNSFNFFVLTTVKISLKREKVKQISFSLCDTLVVFNLCTSFCLAKIAFNVLSVEREANIVQENEGHAEQTIMMEWEEHLYLQ